jgi:hypothetical protein
MTISGPAAGSEVTYFDAIMTIVLKLSSMGGTDLRAPFYNHGTVKFPSICEA